jgi:excisionase family DNA binding protein
MNEKKILNKLNEIENLLFLQKNKLTVRETAIYTGYKESYIYQLTSKQKIPHSKPEGGAIFFDREELEAWMSRNSIPVSQETISKAHSFKI